ncbi:hypothetical protein LFN31_003634 [Vibrio cholerae]|uniref:hypothetical protein n=1 Tax=Vibrio cholerae TaxID=666 RepID=UPI00215B8B12|nr:hypothetical protein [Vibrio cholerae]EIE9613252.1 hypothetical protein [Vibrio cholerae]EJK2104648.1 hypothetical protein [Vibrio cholerae]MCR9698416.1 hypothetical protein [Vibrio cholerae]HDZ3764079.1 hypothetical protein [Vibrio cholerae]
MNNDAKYLEICTILEEQHAYSKQALELFPKLYATCKDVEMAKELTLDIICWAISVPDMSRVEIKK